VFEFSIISNNSFVFLNDSLIFSYKLENFKRCWSNESEFSILLVFESIESKTSSNHGSESIWARNSDVSLKIN